MEIYSPSQVPDQLRRVLRSTMSMDPRASLAPARRAMSVLPRMGAKAWLGRSLLRLGKDEEAEEVRRARKCRGSYWCNMIPALVI